MIWAIAILAFGLMMLKLHGDKREREKPFHKYRKFKLDKYRDEIPKDKDKRF